jgi:branched-chain amino acid transport system substrate-binding protein
LSPKMFGGTMIGLLITPIKMQLGPMLDGIVISESFVPAPSFNFPGVTDVLKRYQAKAAGEKIDPIGYAFVPFGYAAGQVLEQAVETTKTVDPAILADYIHHHTFYTVVGEINYAADGAWAAPRTLITQFQNVAAGNIDQFRDGSVQPILWPPQYKTGSMVYPYAAAKK